MEFILSLSVIGVMIARWLYVRDRFAHLEARIEALADRMTMAPAGPAVAPVENWPVRVYPRPTVPPPRPRPPVVRTVPPVPVERPAAAEPVAEPEPDPSTDWEAVLGGNWLNKAGMLILVIGMALALGYSFTYMGPAGRVAASLAASGALIGTGVLLERRERYRTFGRGLIGGGWAALYVTVYAMHALDAARVVTDPWLASLLLIGVAAGMVLHSLVYGSQTVSGLAYGIAYMTLAITEVNSLSVIALAPLAASLLFVARRFAWRQFAVAGAAATYLTCALRGDSGAPLWQAQAIFAVYWLLFEAFDIASHSDWLMPVNAAGFLGLSLIKWQSADPAHLWQFFAGAAVVYLASTVLRVRAGRWHGTLAVAAGLAASAFLIKLDRQWSAVALLAEAELLYLTGVRLQSRFVRYVAAGVFALHVVFLMALPHPAAWATLMGITIALFYINRLMQKSDVFYGYAGAALAAQLAYERAPAGDFPLAWLVLAVVALLAGWRGARDFQFQACGLAALAILGMAFRPAEPLLSMILAVMALYTAAVALPAARPAHAVASGLLALLLYRQVSGSVLTVAWGAQGVALLAAGFPLRDRTLRLSGMGLLLVCILKLFLYDLSYLETLPRIFSFIVLGLLLVGVSWLYTRFRERIERFL